MNGLEAASPYANVIVHALLDSVGVGTLLFIAMFVAMSLLPKMNAATRHALWWTALLCIALMPAIGFAYSLSRHQQGPGQNAIQTANHSSTLQVVLTTEHKRRSAGTETSLAVRPRRAIDRLAGELRALQGLSAYAVAVWLLVGVAGIASLARSLARLARAKCAAFPIPSALVGGATSSGRMGRPILICASDTIELPIAAGLWSPAILLPQTLVDAAPADMLQQIIHHEAAHLRRYDDWSNLVQRMIERLFWFNPAVFLVGHQIELEREMACDDWAVAQGGNDRRFAACLLEVARVCGFHKSALLAPAALLRSQLSARIEHLLDESRNHMPGAKVASVLFALPLLIGALFLIQQRAPAMAVAHHSNGSLVAARVASVSHPSVFLPEAANRTRLNMPDGVVVFVNHDSMNNVDIIQIDGHRIHLADILDELQVYRRRSATGMIIKAAANTEYGTVLTIMDAAHSVGFSKFGLANRIHGLSEGSGAPPGFEKRLPTTPQSKITKVSTLRPVEVMVNAKNQVWIDGKQTPTSGLYMAMAQAVSFHRKHAAQGYSTHIALVADSHAAFGTIVTILDAARQARDDDVGFVTD